VTETAVATQTKKLWIVDDAHARHLRIVALRRDAERTFLDLGAELYEFHKSRGWAALGYRSFNSYLGDPDVDLTRSIAYATIQIHAKFVAELDCPTDGLIDAGMSKLALLAPVVDEGNVDDWLADASTLSRTDLRQKIAVDCGANVLPVRYRDWARAWKRAAKKWRQRARMSVVLRRERG